MTTRLGARISGNLGRQRSRPEQQDGRSTLFQSLQALDRDSGQALNGPSDGSSVYVFCDLGALKPSQPSISLLVCMHIWLSAGF